jgi:outer membrane protein assembly factor BamB
LATALGDGIFTSPAIAAGMVVAGSYDGIVIAADVATGAIRRQFQAESYFLSSPARVEGRVHLADGAGHLYAQDAINGEEQWRAVVGESGDRALGTTAVARNVVYCVDASRRVGESTLLRAYDAATAEERWRFEADQELHLRGTAVVAGDLIYVATRESLVLAVDLHSGEELMRYDAGSATRTELAVVNGLIYVGTEDGDLHAIDLDAGKERWSRQLSDEAAPISPPTVADGIVYVGDTGGGMHALDAATGDKRWSAGVGSLRSSPAVISGMPYVGGNEGSLRAVGGDGAQSLIRTRAQH